MYTCHLLSRICFRFTEPTIKLLLDLQFVKYLVGWNRDVYLMLKFLQIKAICQSYL